MIKKEEKEENKELHGLVALVMCLNILLYRSRMFLVIGGYLTKMILVGLVSVILSTRMGWTS